MHPTLLLLLSLAALAPALPMNQAEDTEYASYKPYAKYTPYSSAVEQEAAKMDSMPMPMRTSFPLPPSHKPQHKTSY